MLPNDLKYLLGQYGLEMYWPLLLQKSLPAIRFYLKGLEDDDNLPIGVSKIGGMPDLPMSMKWPIRDGKPLSFLVQINLASCAKFKCATSLPNKGLLSFFYNSQEQPWGFDPDHKGSWQVLYLPQSLESFIRFDPDNVDIVFETSAIVFEQTITLPSWDSNDIQSLNMPITDNMTYVDLLEELQYPRHQLFGHPAQIQGDMKEECQLVTNGLYCGDETGYNDPRRESLQDGIQDWILLLQLDSDDIAEMMWGDCGRLFFWIRKQDLETRCFDKTWLILQCS